MEEEIRKAFIAGFKKSGEGFNGEYPPDAMESDYFKQELENYVKLNVRKK